MNALANDLNQYTSRTTPSHLGVIGSADPAAAVTLDGNPAIRTGSYFFAETERDNSAGVSIQTLATTAVKFDPVADKDKIAQLETKLYHAQNPEAFTQDDDGHLTVDGRWNYFWDAENRLTRMEEKVLTGATTRRKLEFTYDFAHRRKTKKMFSWNGGTGAWNTNPDTSTLFVYNGMKVAIELDALTSNSSLRRYLWGADLSGSMDGAAGVGGLLVINDASGSEFYAAHDLTGNILALFDSGTAAIAAEYEYGPFGEMIKAAGPAAFTNPIRWSSKLTDDETDLVYYGYRFYQPEIGRWLNRDPIDEDGGLKIFAQVENNPIYKVDYLGLSPCDKIKRKLMDKQLEISRLGTRIRNLRSEIQERTGKLAENPRNLPWQIPGQPITTAPRTTVAGHIFIRNEMKMHLDKHEGELGRFTLELATLQCEYAACLQAQKSVLKSLTTLGKKCLTFACRKTPIAVVLVACDVAEGGVCHAINEFAWPVSAVWTSEILMDQSTGNESYAGPQYGP